MQQEARQNIFNQWLKQYQALLFKVVRAYAFTPDDQEDLFQEISLQLWNSIPKFRQEAAVSTWLYRIALNTAITWTKKEKRHQAGRQNLGNMEHLLEEKAKAKDDRLVWLYEEIARLNEIDRSLTLLLLDGFSYKEMADILGISESHIGVKIHRIKKHLTSRSKKYHPYGI